VTVWWGLLRKELLEISRDKRALMTSLGLAFMAPLVIYGGISFSIKQASATPPAWIDVLNPEAAPALVELLAEARIYASGTHDDPGTGEKTRLALEIDPEFSAAIAAGSQARVTLRGELNEDAVRPVLNRVRGLLQEFSASTAGVRLLMRGVDPRLLRPLDVQERNTAAAANNAGSMTMMIGIYVIMAAFFSAIATAVDSSAGERERNVLEVLLIQPVRTIDIVSAKLVGVFLVAMLGVLLTLTFSAFAMSQVELEKVGLSFSLSPLNFLFIVLAMVPVAFLAASLQLLVAFFSRTFKEAQSQVSLVIMIPAFAPLILMFIPQPPDWLRQLPVTGQFLYLEQVFKTETVNPTGPLISAAGTLALCAVFVWLTSRHLASARSINAL
jgi:sodium transport system permease protein